MQIRKEQIEGHTPISILNQTKKDEHIATGLTELPLMNSLPAYPSSYADIGTSYSGVLRGQLNIETALQTQKIRIKTGLTTASTFTINIIGLSPGLYDAELIFDIDFLSGVSTARKFYISGTIIVNNSGTYKSYSFIEKVQGTVDVSTDFLFSATFEGGDASDSFNCDKLQLINTTHTGII